MTENEMVKRVALAIWQAREQRFPERVRRMPPDDMDRLAGAWDNLLADARAAIEAMRDPDLAMRKVCTFEEAEITWPAMIDAALK